MMLRLCITSLCLIALSLQADAAEKLFVSAKVLNVRLCPAKDCPVTNRIYRQQVVEVFAVQGEWARISKYYDAAAERAEFPNLRGNRVARWVAREFLISKRPEDIKQPELDSSLIDSRMNGIPKVGNFGLGQTDVVRLRKFGKELLDKGECNAIDLADKSVNRPNTYYVHCVGETRNRLFTAQDVE